jgi:hypothetical protein
MVTEMNPSLQQAAHRVLGKSHRRILFRFCRRRKRSAFADTGASATTGGAATLRVVCARLRKGYWPIWQARRVAANPNAIIIERMDGTSNSPEINRRLHEPLATVHQNDAAVADLKRQFQSLLSSA